MNFLSFKGFLLKLFFFKTRFLGDFDAKSFLAFLYQLIKNLTLKVFKKTLFLGGISGIKRGGE
ncbi:hypothetical protein Neuguinea42_03350 [Helicobacter pylori]